MCHGLRTAFVAPRSSRFSTPRLSSWCSSAASSNSPWRIRLNTRRMPTSTTRLRIAITYRNTPDTDVPMRPVALCSVDESSSTCPASARTPRESSRHSAKTIVECPSENQNPTDSGRWPSAISLRVVLSIAAMWSASNACRMPSVNAVTPSPIPNTPDVPSA